MKQIKWTTPLLAAALLFPYAPGVYAQDEPAPEEEAVAEVIEEKAPAAPAPEPTPEPEAKPEPKPAPIVELPDLKKKKKKRKKAAAKAKCPPAPAAKEKKADAPLAGCASSLKEVAEAYRKAYEDFNAWLPAASAKVADADKREKTLQTTIEENEKKLTQLKMKNRRADRSKIRDLKRSNKQLWKDLRTVGKEKAAICKTLSKTAAMKVKELNAGISMAVKGLREKMR